MNTFANFNSNAVTFDQIFAAEEILRKLSNATYLTEETRAALDLAKDVFCSIRVAVRINGGTFDTTTLRDHLIDRDGTKGAVPCSR